jgi:hypothetical protein
VVSIGARVVVVGDALVDVDEAEVVADPTFFSLSPLHAAAVTSTTTASATRAICRARPAARPSPIIASSPV